MGDVVAKATEPALAAIKLAWWRERVGELDQGKVPAEPRLQAAAQVLLNRGISGAMLAELEDGWAALLEEVQDEKRVASRGEKLFELAARLVGAQDPKLGIAGRLFAAESLARQGLATISSAENLHRLAGYRFPRRLRPLTALSALAARDARQSPTVEPEGTPGRALTLLRHRLTGRIG